MKFIALTSVVAVLASAASAFARPSLSARKALDVFVPTITSPQAGDIWVVGSIVTVTWDTSDAPHQITNKRGQIMLAKDGYAYPIVLAVGFDILDGATNFTVPNVLNGTNYEIQLFGDSGNFSPPFTITGSNSFF